MFLGSLLAECTGADPCEIPTGLPWYFGIAVGAVWLTVVIGTLLLGRRWLRRKFERRRSSGDRLALERRTSGSDVDLW